MLCLQSSLVPVPRPRACALLGADETIRLDAIRAMGRLWQPSIMFALPERGPGSSGWTRVWSGQPSTWQREPAIRMSSHRPPAVVLRDLQTNRPARGGSVCLLHGDDRTKNLI